MAGHSMRKLLQVPPGSAFDLQSVDPRSTPGLPDTREVKQDQKAWSRAQLAELAGPLAEEQEKLYASAKVGDDRRRLLVVLQAMDCGGKDGTVHHVIGQLNPQGVQVRGFGVPTPEERKHHFLWRIRRALPDPGYVGVFNRSHYEDVLVARVHQLVPAERWRQRYGQINEFERELADDGVTLLKIMLHISPEEQLERLTSRLDDPTKRWKYNPSDVDARNHWQAYQEAYVAAITATSTVDIPWYVVPANRKWYRDWAVAHVLHETLVDLDLQYPEPDLDIEHEKARLKGWY